MSCTEFGNTAGSKKRNRPDFAFWVRIITILTYVRQFCPNWLKASIEYENEVFQHLGSVVTNEGYSDWATTEIDAGIQSMWYRFSRREDDYCIECSEDGVHFQQMRICHMHRGDGKIQFGIYACSPEDSSFKAVFSHMKLTECQWKAHDGQQPDEC